MFNLGTRQTCCYPDDDLSSATIGGYRFDHTVDHIMAKPKLKQLDSEVTGDNPKVKTASGLVSSDHGGLWSTRAEEAEEEQELSEAGSGR